MNSSSIIKWHGMIMTLWHNDTTEESNGVYAYEDILFVLCIS